MSLDYNRIEYLTEGKITAFLEKAINKIKGRLIPGIPDKLEKNNSVKQPKRSMKKRLDALELDYDMLVSNKDVKRFMREFDSTYFDMSKKEIMSEMKMALEAVADWIDTLNKHHNMKINKNAFLNRFMPFYELGNGDYGMLDRQTKFFVWFAHNSQKVVVDQVGRKIYF